MTTETPEPPVNTNKTTGDRLHPAQAVSNIKNSINIVLDLEKGNYISWSELFEIHCCATDVLDHIIPEPTDPDKENSSSSSSSGRSPEEQKVWARLDAIVKQWIYATISPDLMETVLQKNLTAQQTWERLATLFHDNQTTRALYLRNKFSNTKLDSFSNVASYCQELKTIADQLANVGSSVTDEQLVLQVLAGLNDAFDGVGMFIQHMHPLPTFYETRSKLILEENRIKNKQQPNVAFVTTSNHPPQTSKPPVHPQTDSAHPTPQNHSPSYYPTHDPRFPYDPSSHRGRGRSPRGRGRGGRRGGRRGGFTPSYHHYYPTYPHTTYQPSPYSPHHQPWPTPPVPYPTSPYRPNTPPNTRPPVSHQPGILGPPPSHQAYNATDHYTPTNIEHALHTMTLNPDQNWYLDTGASSHMTNSTGLPDADSYPTM